MLQMLPPSLVALGPHPTRPSLPHLPQKGPEMTTDIYASRGPYETRTTPPMPDMSNGACNGVDLELFFPVYAGSKAEKKVIETYCKKCPIQTLCAAWAIPNEEFGIFGGLNEVQRREIRVKMTRAA
jgi:hypothetical protein